MNLPSVPARELGVGIFLFRQRKLRPLADHRQLAGRSEFRERRVGFSNPPVASNESAAMAAPGFGSTPSGAAFPFGRNE
jgi:hypothetical protein